MDKNVPDVVKVLISVIKSNNIYNFCQSLCPSDKLTILSILESYVNQFEHKLNQFC